MPNTVITGQTFDKIEPDKWNEGHLRTSFGMGDGREVQNWTGSLTHEIQTINSVTIIPATGRPSHAGIYAEINLVRDRNPSGILDHLAKTLPENLKPEFKADGTGLNQGTITIALKNPEDFTKVLGALGTEVKNGSVPLPNSQQIIGKAITELKLDPAKAGLVTIDISTALTQQRAQESYGITAKSDYPYADVKLNPAISEHIASITEDLTPSLDIKKGKSTFEPNVRITPHNYVERPSVRTPFGSAEQQAKMVEENAASLRAYKEASSQAERHTRIIHNALDKAGVKHSYEPGDTSLIVKGHTVDSILPKLAEHGMVIPEVANHITNHVDLASREIPAKPANPAELSAARARLSGAPTTETPPAPFARMKDARARKEGGFVLGTNTSSDARLSEGQEILAAYRKANPAPEPTTSSPHSSLAAAAGKANAIIGATDTITQLAEGNYRGAAISSLQTTLGAASTYIPAKAGVLGGVATAAGSINDGITEYKQTGDASSARLATEKGAVKILATGLAVETTAAFVTGVGGAAAGAAVAPAVGAAAVGYTLGAIAGNKIAQNMENDTTHAKENASSESKYNNDFGRTEIGHYTQLSKLAQQSGLQGTPTPEQLEKALANKQQMLNDRSGISKAWDFTKSVAGIEKMTRAQTPAEKERAEIQGMGQELSVLKQATANAAKNNEKQPETKTAADVAADPRVSAAAATLKSSGAEVADAASRQHVAAAAQMQQQRGIA